jgi:hypothetical protein
MYSYIAEYDMFKVFWVSYISVAAHIISPVNENTFGLIMGFMPVIL